MLVVKKYGNRRLYDTDQSRYITLEELTERIRSGIEVKVVDAKTNADLTQATLTQVIIEGRGVGAFLPVPLLHQLIRLGDDSLAEFFNRYVQLALEMYLQMKAGVSSLSPFNPFAAMNPFASAMLRPFQSGGGAPSPAPAPAAPQTDVETLKRELDELKKALKPRTRRR